MNATDAEAAKERPKCVVKTERLSMNDNASIAPLTLKNTRLQINAVTTVITKNRRSKEGSAPNSGFRYLINQLVDLVTFVVSSIIALQTNCVQDSVWNVYIRSGRLSNTR